MAKNIFVSIDSNIFVRGWTQGKPGCEIEHWRALQAKVDSGEVTLLMSEVVSLECEKQWQVVNDDINLRLKDAKSEITNWFLKSFKSTEIEDIGKALSAEVEKLHTTKTATINANRLEFDKLVNSTKSKMLPYTQEVHFNAHKRMISGKFTNAGDRNRKSSNDCAIIETLKAFFSDKISDDNQLLFCSENLSDFGTTLPNKSIVFHPILSEGLPPTEIFTDMQSMLKFIGERKTVAKPSESELKDAVQQEQEVEQEREIESSDEKLFRFFPRHPGNVSVEQAVLSILLHDVFNESPSRSLGEITGFLKSLGYNQGNVLAAVEYLEQLGFIKFGPTMFPDEGNSFAPVKLTRKGFDFCHNFKISRRLPKKRF